MQVHTASGHQQGDLADVQVQLQQFIAMQTCMCCIHTCIICACIACITTCMLCIHIVSPAGIIKTTSFWGWAGSCDTTAAAAAMLDFRCVTSILILATSILVLAAKL